MDIRVCSIMDNDIFGSRLTQLRQAKGVSARDMSISVGQNAGYINRIENSNMLPSMEMFFCICDFLKVSPKEFFDIKNIPPLQARELVADIEKLNERDLSLITGMVKRYIEDY